jgi:agmatine deiminase
MDYNDCWTRDMGPIFIYRAGQRVGLDWTFNGWGKQFPWRRDDAFPAACLDYLHVPRQPVSMVLEGGQILIDGQGTLITTAESMLNKNRNPGMSKQQIEAELKARFGVTKVIWLPYGLYGDTITGGHVDGVANFIAPGKLMIQVTAPGTPDYKRLQANKAVLQAATDAQGRHFQLVELTQYPTLRFGEFGGFTTTHSYINYYLCNGAVIVPIAGLPEDAGALATIRSAFPDRTVVGVETLGLTAGGGGVHCVTQQVIPERPPS